MTISNHNCPFSLNVWDASPKIEGKIELYSDIMTCADVNAENNNAGCAFYDKDSEKCLIRNGLLSLKMLSEPRIELINKKNNE